MPGTCCVAGDPLVHVATGSGSEIVGLTVGSGLAVSCGGFGAAVEDIGTPSDPVVLGGATSRCQHAAIGPVLDGDRQVLYLTHHGDTWIDAPFLATAVVGPDGEVTTPFEHQDLDVLYEDVTWSSNGWVYVAAHGGGLRTYQVDAETAEPQFVAALAGFDNASQLELDGAWLYVGDGSGGLKVVSVAEPSAPSIVATVPVTGTARDLAVNGDRLYVAAGGDGVFILDIGDPTTPVEVGHIPVLGTAQGVDANDDIIAVAAWSHAAVYDVLTQQLLATERTRFSPSFEQDTSIAIDGQHVYVGEWEDLHVLRYEPGMVAPDIWIDLELLSFPGDEQSTRAVVVRNHGYLDLDIDAITTSDQETFTVDTTYVRVPPLSGRAFEVTYTPLGPDTQGDTAFLGLTSNDPDERENPLDVPLVARSGGGVDVGDVIDERWAFIDPTGATDLSGLQGHVIVLAYFALF